MELNKAIKSRKSVRKFNKKKPNWKDILDCIDSMRYAPTAGNNCTLKIILVDDPKKIEKVSKACQQDFITEAKYLVAVCSKKERLVNAYGNEGEKFNKQQVGSAIQNLLLNIEEKELSTCWIGYFVEEQIKELLSIPKDIEVEAVFPIGFQKEKETTKRVKTDLKNILYFNKYGEERMKPLRKID